MAKTFEYPVRIVERHLDTFGHVNNARYFEIFEEARWEIVNRGGFGLDDISRSGLGPTILEITIRFMREARLHQNFTVRTQLENVSGKICLIRQELVDSAGAVACEAKFKIGLFDIRKRKLVDPTPEWLHAVGQE